ncbi:MAG: ABC transporter ATP-binding protein [Anaerolineae bacterium]|nr:ABC transporter ATP-binding protein [Anaerolineae bacterium]
MPYAIETYELTKRFGPPRRGEGDAHRRFPFLGTDRRRGVLAVDRVTIRIREGEMFGLLGPNGAGKTTLVKLLCTLILPSSGSARVAGYDLRDDSHVRRVIGLSTGDERSFFWRLSGRENLLFFAALYGLPPSRARYRVDEVLDKLEISEWADQRFATYSSGQKQRLSIARALLPHPRILFLDEPTRSLDPKAARHLHDLILNDLHRREGMTIFLTTHRLDEAERLCDRIAIMHRGRIQACGTLDELRSVLRPQARYRLRVAGLPGERSWPDEWGHLEMRSLGDGQVELVLDAANGEEDLARLIAWIVRAGGQVFSATEERPSLEQVFDRFTREAADDV